MKKISHISCIGLLLIIQMFAQEKSVAGETSLSNRGLIRGMVSDAEVAYNLKPGDTRREEIPEAAVTVENEILMGDKKITVITGSEGEFQIPSLLPGEYTITIKKQGYDILTDHITVNSRSETVYHAKLWKEKNSLKDLLLGEGYIWGLLAASALALYIYISRRRSKNISEKSN